MMGPSRGRQLGIAMVLMMATALAAPAGAADPLHLSDLHRLLEAGIGPDLVLMQVQRTGTRLDLDVEELISLRRAGAHDALLAGLMRPGDGAGQDAGVKTAAAASVRVFLETEHDGRQAMVLTNLDENGERLDGTPVTAVRGVISSSDRGDPVAPADASPAPAATAALLPPTMEITVRRDPEDRRLEELEERLQDLESAEPGLPPVGADLPRYPINDFREYPVLPFGYGLGYGVAYPVVAPQDYEITTYPSLPSFTSAYAVGIDPFRPVPPCSPGQACSVHQRLAYP